MVLILAVCFTVITSRPMAAWIASAYPYPATWTVARLGMTSSQVRRAAGEPQADGAELKTVDRWILDHGIVSLHMDVFFKTGWHDDADTVVAIYQWKRLLGHTVDEQWNSNGDIEP